MPLPFIVAPIIAAITAAGAGTATTLGISKAIDKKKAKNNSNKSNNVYKSGTTIYNATKSSSSTPKTTNNYAPKTYSRSNYTNTSSHSNTLKKEESETMNFSVGDKVKIKKCVNCAYKFMGEYINLTSAMKNAEWTIKTINADVQGRVRIKSLNDDLLVYPRNLEYVSTSSTTRKTSKKQSTDNSVSDSGYKFTALGLSGSGKTCFMAGMYYKMAGGFEGYTLKADDDDDVKLSTMYEKMKNFNAGADRFPVGTNQTSKHSFELQYQYDTIEKFEWIDYDGNALKLKNSGNAEEYQKLKKDISQSEILYVFVDGALFDDEELKFAETDRDKIEILSDIVSDSCSRQVNHFISEYAKENYKLPPIAIVVTKYDIINEVLGKATNNETTELLHKIIKKAFNPLFPDPTVFSGKSGHTSMVGIIPVSLGVTISKDNYKGRLRPVNMHLPIYMGIWFMLKKTCDYLRENKLTSEEKFKSVLQKQESAMNKLSHELEECGSQFYLNGQTGKFAELANAYTELQKEKV